MTTEVLSHIHRIDERSDQQNTDPPIAEAKHGKFPRVCPVPGCERTDFSLFKSFRRHWNSTHQRMIELRKCLISGNITDGLSHCHRKKHRRNKQLYTKVYIPNDSYMDPGTVTSNFHVKQQPQNMSTYKTLEPSVDDGLRIKGELMGDMGDREPDLSGASNMTDTETNEHLPGRTPELAVASNSIVIETNEDLAGRKLEQINQEICLKGEMPLWPNCPSPCPVPECAEGASFPTFDDFNAHWTKFHKVFEDIYQCIKCGMQFPKLHAAYCHQMSNAQLKKKSVAIKHIMFDKTLYIDPQSNLPYCNNSNANRAENVEECIINVNTTEKVSLKSTPTVNISEGNHKFEAIDIEPERKLASNIIVTETNEDPGTVTPYFHNKQQPQNMSTYETLEPSVDDGLRIKGELPDLSGASNTTDTETKEHLPGSTPELAVTSNSIVVETNEDLASRKLEQRNKTICLKGGIPLWPNCPSPCPVPECAEGASFPTFDDFNAHWTKFHKVFEDIYQCSKCGMQFDNFFAASCHKNSKEYHRTRKGLFIKGIRNHNTQYIDPHGTHPYRNNAKSNTTENTQGENIENVKTAKKVSFKSIPTVRISKRKHKDINKNTKDTPVVKISKQNPKGLFVCETKDIESTPSLASNLIVIETKDDLADREPEPTVTSNVIVTGTCEDLAYFEFEPLDSSHVIVTEIQEDFTDRDPEATVASNVTVTETREASIDREPEQTDTSNVIVTETRDASVDREPIDTTNANSIDTTEPTVVSNVIVTETRDASVDREPIDTTNANSIDTTEPTVVSNVIVTETRDASVDREPIDATNAKSIDTTEPTVVSNVIVTETRDASVDREPIDATNANSIDTTEPTVVSNVIVTETRDASVDREPIDATNANSIDTTEPTVVSNVIVTETWDASVDREPIDTTNANSIDTTEPTVTSYVTVTETKEDLADSETEPTVTSYVTVKETKGDLAVSQPEPTAVSNVIVTETKKYLADGEFETTVVSNVIVASKEDLADSESEPTDTSNCIVTTTKEYFADKGLIPTVTSNVIVTETKEYLVDRETETTVASNVFVANKEALADSESELTDTSNGIATETREASADREHEQTDTSNDNAIDTKKDLADSEPEPTVNLNIIDIETKEDLAHIEPKPTEVSNAIDIETKEDLAHIERDVTKEDLIDIEPGPTNASNVIVTEPKEDLADIEPEPTVTTNTIVIETNEDLAGKEPTNEDLAGKEPEPTALSNVFGTHTKEKIADYEPGPTNIIITETKDDLADIEPGPRVPSNSILSETNEDLADMAPKPNASSLLDSETKEDLADIQPEPTVVSNVIVTETYNYLANREIETTAAPNAIASETNDDHADRESDSIEISNTNVTETKEDFTDKEPEATVASDFILTETNEDLTDIEPEPIASSVIVKETKEDLADIEPEPTVSSDAIVTETKADLDDREHELTAVSNVIVTETKEDLAGSEPDSTATSDGIVTEAKENLAGIGPEPKKTSDNVIVIETNEDLAEREPESTVTSNVIVIKTKEDLVNMTPGPTETSYGMVTERKRDLADIEPERTVNLHAIVTETKEDLANRELAPTEVSNTIVAEIKEYLADKETGSTICLNANDRQSETSSPVNTIVKEFKDALAGKEPEQLSVSNTMDAEVKGELADNKQEPSYDSITIVAGINGHSADRKAETSDVTLNTIVSDKREDIGSTEWPETLVASNTIDAERKGNLDCRESESLIASNTSVAEITAGSEKTEAFITSSTVAAELNGHLADRGPETSGASNNIATESKADLTITKSLHDINDIIMEIKDNSDEGESDLICTSNSSITEIKGLDARELDTLGATKSIASDTKGDIDDKGPNTLKFSKTIASEMKLNDYELDPKPDHELLDGRPIWPMRFAYCPVRRCRDLGRFRSFEKFIDHWNSFHIEKKNRFFYKCTGCGRQCTEKYQAIWHKTEVCVGFPFTYGCIFNNFIDPEGALPYQLSRAIKHQNKQAEIKPLQPAKYVKRQYKQTKTYQLGHKIQQKATKSITDDTKHSPCIQIDTHSPVPDCPEKNMNKNPVEVSTTSYSTLTDTDCTSEMKTTTDIISKEKKQNLCPVLPQIETPHPVPSCPEKNMNENSVEISTVSYSILTDTGYTDEKKTKTDKISDENHSLCPVLPQIDMPCQVPSCPEKNIDENSVKMSTVSNSNLTDTALTDIIIDEENHTLCPVWPQVDTYCPVPNCPEKNIFQTFESFALHWVFMHRENVVVYQCKLCSQKFLTRKFHPHKGRIIQKSVKINSGHLSLRFDAIHCTSASFVDPKNTLPYRQGSPYIRNKVRSLKNCLSAVIGSLENALKCTPIGVLKTSQIATDTDIENKGNIKRIKSKSLAVAKLEKEIRDFFNRQPDFLMEIEDMSSNLKSEMYKHKHLEITNSKVNTKLSNFKTEDISGSSTSSVTDYQQVIAQPWPLKPSRCPVPDCQSEGKFPSFDDFACHWDKVHSKINVYNCENCGNQFKSKLAAKNHQRWMLFTKDFKHIGVDINIKFVNLANTDYVDPKGILPYQYTAKMDSTRQLQMKSRNASEVNNHTTDSQLAVSTAVTEKENTCMEDGEDENRKIWPLVPASCLVPECKNKGNFSTFDDFLSHWSNIHSKKRLLICKECSNIFDTHESFKTHKPCADKEKPFLFSYKDPDFIDPQGTTPYRYGSTDEREELKKTEIRRQSHLWPNCPSPCPVPVCAKGASFPTFDDFMAHWIKFHKQFDYIYQCSKCRMQFGNFLAGSCHKKSKQHHRTPKGISIKRIMVHNTLYIDPQGTLPYSNANKREHSKRDNTIEKVSSEGTPFLRISKQNHNNKYAKEWGFFECTPPVRISKRNHIETITCEAIDNQSVVKGVNFFLETDEEIHKIETITGTSNIGKKQEQLYQRSLYGINKNSEAPIALDSAAGVHQSTTCFPQSEMGIFQSETGMFELPTGMFELPTGVSQSVTEGSYSAPCFSQSKTGIFEPATEISQSVIQFSQLGTEMLESAAGVSQSAIWGFDPAAVTSQSGSCFSESQSGMFASAIGISESPTQFSQSETGMFELTTGVSPSTTQFSQSETRMFESGTGMLELRTGVYQPATWGFDPAAGFPQPALGFSESTTGMFKSATGISQSADQFSESETGTFERVTRNSKSRTSRFSQSETLHSENVSECLSSRSIISQKARSDTKKTAKIPNPEWPGVPTPCPVSACQNLGNFTTLKQFDRHWKEHHASSYWYQCKSCDTRFNYQNSAKAHLDLCYNKGGCILEIPNIDYIDPENVPRYQPFKRKNKLRDAQELLSSVREKLNAIKSSK